MMMEMIGWSWGCFLCHGAWDKVDAWILRKCLEDVMAWHADDSRVLASFFFL